MSRYNPMPKDFKPEGDMNKHESWEEKTWRNKAHTTESGDVFIPAAAFKFAISAAARYLNDKISGQGNKTYAKKFDCGIMIIDDVPIGWNIKDATKKTLLVSSTGQKNGGTKVIKHFPQFPKWSGKLRVYILDDIITKEVLVRHVEAAGTFIGIHQYRPEKGGTNGRFTVQA